MAQKESKIISLILLAHPEAELANRLQELLSQPDIFVIYTRNAKYIDELIRESKPEVILCTIDEKLANGKYLYQLSKQPGYDFECILLVDKKQLDKARKLVLEQHVYDYFIVNPAYDALHLEIVVRAAIRHLRLRMENKGWEEAVNQFRDRHLIEKIHEYRDGIVEDLRKKVRDFRNRIAPSEGGGIVEVRDWTAFENYYHQLENTGVQEAVSKKAERVGEVLQTTLKEASREVRERTIQSLENRLAKVPDIYKQNKGKRGMEKVSGGRVLAIGQSWMYMTFAVEYLNAMGYQVKTIESLENAENSIPFQDFDVAILEITGWSIEQISLALIKLRALVGSGCGLIVMVPEVTGEMVLLLRHAGAQDLIVHPINMLTVEAKINKLITKIRNSTISA